MPSRGNLARDTAWIRLTTFESQTRWLLSQAWLGVIKFISRPSHAPDRISHHLPFIIRRLHHPAENMLSCSRRHQRVSLLRRHSFTMTAVGSTSVLCTTRRHLVSVPYPNPAPLALATGTGTRAGTGAGAGISGIGIGAGARTPRFCHASAPIATAPIRSFTAGHNLLSFARPTYSSSHFSSTTTTTTQLFPCASPAGLGKAYFSTSRAVMGAVKIDGTAIAKRIRENLQAEIEERKKTNPRYAPSLKIIQGMATNPRRMRLLLEDGG